MRLSQLSASGWQILTVSVAFVGGATVGVLCWTISTTALLAVPVLGFTVGAAIFALLMVVIRTTNEKLNRVAKYILEDRRRTDEIKSLINIRPLLGSEPIRFDGWAMNPSLAETIAFLVFQEKPQLVLECGSGSSTVFVASCFRKADCHNAEIISLDHDAEYADATRDLVKQHGLEGSTNVLDSALKKWDLGGKDHLWYGINTEIFSDRKIDMLIVDGPPQQVEKMARYPAVPILKPYLSEKCVIILDDGDRTDEREAAHRWARELSCDLKYEGGRKGTWVLRRRETSQE